MLGSFSCGVDGAVDLPPAGARLVAFLALQRHPVTRHRVAGVLWPDATDERALASLRSTLWRLGRCARGMVDARDDRLAIAPCVDIDTETLAGQARRLIDDEPIDLDSIDLASFGAELLPDWYDDWVLFERERLRQLALHALEAVSRRHLEAGRHAPAIEAGMVAVSLEPLRESAHGCVIDAHLAEDNLAEALAHFRSYSRLLEHDLGVGPSAHLVARLDAQLRDRPVHRPRPSATPAATARPTPRRALSRYPERRPRV
jgi:DNA-binding SARP family transcriptional activator